MMAHLQAHSHTNGTPPGSLHVPQMWGKAGKNQMGDIPCTAVSMGLTPKTAQWVPPFNPTKRAHASHHAAGHSPKALQAGPGALPCTLCHRGWK